MNDVTYVEQLRKTICGEFYFGTDQATDCDLDRCEQRQAEIFTVERDDCILSSLSEDSSPRQSRCILFSTGRVGITILIIPAVGRGWFQILSS